MSRYSPLTQLELDAIGLLEGFQVPSWNGPALPRPDGDAGLEEIIDTVDKLIARGQYLIQAKDGLSIEYTLRGITATAERFMLGTEDQVEEAALLRLLLTYVESFLSTVFSDKSHRDRISSEFSEFRAKLELRVARPLIKLTGATPSQANASPADDYSAFTLESPDQFAMAWTTFQDLFRHGYAHLDEYVAALTDPEAATRQFWPMIRSTALPYNLFVLRKLTAATAADYRTNFGTGWLSEFDDLLSAGNLYGIDTTIFSSLAPEKLSNDTVRFTPNSMALLTMDPGKNLAPIAVYVADPQNVNNAQTYTPKSPAWAYALFAVKTSMTVYGIWLGHVYTQHIVTAAMLMSALNTLPSTNVIYQLFAPQSNYIVPFDLVLMLAWSSLSPPTSISDTGKFLTLCNAFSARHDFFSTDPANMLATLNPADFTDPAIDQKEWNLYPNVQVVQTIWAMVAAYIDAVVDAGYANDTAVAADKDLANWIEFASTTGNVAGLPKMNSKAALKAVVTSVLYRITFHGLGRLRNSGAPEPPFAPNYPPCLQSTTIPDPGTPLAMADLLNYLPNTGTLGSLVTFYYIFAYNAPYVPLVPHKGPEDELFFDQSKYPAANHALIDFRKGIENFIACFQPDWVQTGQWPRNIEL
jgi:hypothetical protein